MRVTSFYRHEFEISGTKLRQRLFQVVPYLAGETFYFAAKKRATFTRLLKRVDWSNR